MDVQYLRARYYCPTTADFLTEDSYLGNIIDPLTLNRYNYVKSSPLNYVDPSGHYSAVQGTDAHETLKYYLDNKFGNKIVTNKVIEQYAFYYLKKLTKQRRKRKQLHVNL